MGTFFRDHFTGEQPVLSLMVQNPSLDHSRLFPAPLEERAVESGKISRKIHFSASLQKCMRTFFPDHFTSEHPV
jgi:hypothetical protein